VVESSYFVDLPVDISKHIYMFRLSLVSIGVVNFILFCVELKFREIVWKFRRIARKFGTVNSL